MPLISCPLFYESFLWDFDQNSVGGKKNCPLMRGIHLLECPLIEENTVFRFLNIPCCHYIRMAVKMETESHFSVEYNILNIFVFFKWISLELNLHLPKVKFSQYKILVRYSLFKGKRFKGKLIYSLRAISLTNTKQ